MRKTFTYKGSTVSYITDGSGKPVMLVHGFAEDGSLWDAQVAFLKQYCLVIVPDLPGSGLSDYNAALDTVEAHAECLYALMQEERIEQCIMLGHSMGGYITLAFAEKRPELLAAFGFIHSTAFADSEEKKQARLKGIKMIEAYGSYAFVKSTTPNLFSIAYKETFAEKVETLVKNGGNFKAEALQQYYYAMMVRPNRMHVLSNSKIPVLFIAGMEDVVVPLNDALQQVYLPVTSYIHILPNAGHMGMWEATEDVNTYVLQFIEDTA